MDWFPTLFCMIVMYSPFVIALLIGLSRRKKPTYKNGVIDYGDLRDSESGSPFAGWAEEMIKNEKAKKGKH